MKWDWGSLMRDQGWSGAFSGVSAASTARAGLSQASSRRDSCHFIHLAAAIILGRELAPVSATAVRVDLVASREGSILRLSAILSRTALRWFRTTELGLGAIFRGRRRGCGHSRSGSSKAALNVSRNPVLILGLRREGREG